MEWLGRDAISPKIPISLLRASLLIILMKGVSLCLSGQRKMDVRCLLEVTVCQLAGGQLMVPAVRLNQRQTRSSTLPLPCSGSSWRVHQLVFWGIEPMRYYYLPVFIFKNNKRFKWMRGTLVSFQLKCAWGSGFKWRRNGERKCSWAICLSSEEEARCPIYTPFSLFSIPNILFCLWNILCQVSLTSLFVTLLEPLLPIFFSLKYILDAVTPLLKNPR